MVGLRLQQAHPAGTRPHQEPLHAAMVGSTQVLRQQAVQEVAQEAVQVGLQVQ